MTPPPAEQGWPETTLRVGIGKAREVYVYFDNDAKVHAPFDALKLAQRLQVSRL